MSEDAPPQSPGGCVAHVVHPALHARVELGEADRAGAIGIQALDDGALPGPQLPLAVAEQGEVVDVAQVRAAPQLAFHDLLEWPLPKAERFPRSYRTTVTQRLMDSALDLQEHLVDAHSRSGRRRLEALEAADAALDRLRLYLRLAHHWRWLSDGQFRHVSVMVAEIGRLLGGWVKGVRGGGATRRA